MMWSSPPFITYFPTYISTTPFLFLLFFLFLFLFYFYVYTLHLLGNWAATHQLSSPQVISSLWSMGGAASAPGRMIVPQRVRAHCAVACHHSSIVSCLRVPYIFNIVTIHQYFCSPCLSSPCMWQFPFVQSASFTNLSYVMFIDYCICSWRLEVSMKRVEL